MGATYYTPKTLAAHWGCSPDIVYDLLRSGKLHGFRLGRSWRVTEEAREAYETKFVYSHIPFAPSNSASEILYSVRAHPSKSISDSETLVVDSFLHIP